MGPKQDWCAGPLQYQCMDLPARLICCGHYKTTVCAGPLQLKTCSGPLQDQSAGPGPRIWNLDQNSFYREYIWGFRSEHQRNVGSPKVSPRPADVGIIYSAGIVFHILLGGRSHSFTFLVFYFNHDFVSSISVKLCIEW